MSNMPTIDDLDRRVLERLASHPREGILPLARVLGIARGTAQARLDRLVARGVVTGFGQDVDLEAIGYTVLAFVTLEIAQGRFAEVIAALAATPEVVEVHTTTGAGDLHCRVVARTNEHLGAVIAEILRVSGIARTSTVLALSNPVPMRTATAIAAAARHALI